MKNGNRSQWLFYGMGIFIFLLTFSLITLMIVYPAESRTAVDHTGTDIRFNAPRHPLREAVQQNNLSVVMKRIKGAYTAYGLCGGDHADAYILSLTGVADTTGMSPLMTAGSRLGFYELYTFPELAVPLALMMHKRPSLLVPARPFLQNGSNEFPAYIGYVRKADTALLQAMLQESTLSHLFPGDTRFAYREEDCDHLEVYAVRHSRAAIFSSEYILEASSRVSMYSGEPQIVVTFGPEAAAAWERLIATNKGRPLAICLNNRVLSVPVVREEPAANEKAAAAAKREKRSSMG